MKEPTLAEQRCVDELLKTRELRGRQQHMEDPVWTARQRKKMAEEALRDVRVIIRELRIATPGMIDAMKKALTWDDKKAMGGRITPSLKHQIRWAAAIDVASPPNKQGP